MIITRPIGIDLGTTNSAVALLDPNEQDLVLCKDRFNQLMAIAERAKKELSYHDEFMVRDQGTIKDKSGAPIIIETSITRATFESLIGDLLDRTIQCCKEALERARQKSELTIEDVDDILLVGGSTYVPAAVEKVKRAFCRNGSDDSGPRARCDAPIRDEPETAVALGAALRAAASGLGISDEDNHVRLWFQGTGHATRASNYQRLYRACRAWPVSRRGLAQIDRDDRRNDWRSEIEAGAAIRLPDRAASGRDAQQVSLRGAR